MTVCHIYIGCRYPTLQGGQHKCQWCQRMVHNLCHQQAAGDTDKPTDGYACGKNGACLGNNPPLPPQPMSTQAVKAKKGASTPEKNAPEGARFLVEEGACSAGSACAMEDRYAKVDTRRICCEAKCHLQCVQKDCRSCPTQFQDGGSGVVARQHAEEGRLPQKKGAAVSGAAGVEDIVFLKAAEAKAAPSASRHSVRLKEKSPRIRQDDIDASVNAACNAAISDALPRVVKSKAFREALCETVSTKAFEKAATEATDKAEPSRATVKKITDMTCATVGTVLEGSLKPAISKATEALAKATTRFTDLESKQVEKPKTRGSAAAAGTSKDMALTAPAHAKLVKEITEQVTLNARQDLSNAVSFLGSKFNEAVSKGIAEVLREVQTGRTAQPKGNGRARNKRTYQPPPSSSSSSESVDAQTPSPPPAKQKRGRRKSVYRNDATPATTALSTVHPNTIHQAHATMTPLAQQAHATMTPLARSVGARQPAFLRMGNTQAQPGLLPPLDFNDIGQASHQPMFPGANNGPSYGYIF